LKEDVIKVRRRKIIHLACMAKPFTRSTRLC
jgi:hypothetical protein